MICLFQLLAALKKSNFTLLNERVRFNDNGDPMFGSYAASFWNQSGDAEKFGSCSFYPTIQFFINESKIQWHSKEVSRVFLCPDVFVCVLGNRNGDSSWLDRQVFAYEATTL